LFIAAAAAATEDWVRGPDGGLDPAVGDVGAAPELDPEKEALAASIDAADVG
jgi:hypothetical protein